jgi:FixJ family two-component response regulator
MPNPIPNVYVVDDDNSTRESLKELICTAGWQPLLFASAEEFLSHPRQLCPSCLVLEVLLPGLNGFELQERLVSDRADMPIIFVSAQSDVPMIVRAMKAGATEFLAKPLSEQVLLAAIRLALDCSRALQAAASEMTRLQQRYSWLSNREREVMGLVVSGLRNKQVGHELSISEITVKAHRGRVMRKMQAASLAELVTIAAKLHVPPRPGLFRQTSLRPITGTCLPSHAHWPAPITHRPQDPRLKSNEHGTNGGARNEATQWRHG